MKKLIVTAAFLTSMMSLTARAQEPAPAASAPAADPAPAAAGKVTLGVDAAFMLPLGDWADRSGLGFGGLIRGEYNVLPNLNVTGRVGYIYSLKKEESAEGVTTKLNVNVLPIWVGAKYFLTDMFYGGAEVGLNHLMSKGEMSGGGMDLSGSTSDDKLGVNVGAGALISGIDLRAQLSFLSIGDTTDAMALIVTAGYNFMSL